MNILILYILSFLIGILLFKITYNKECFNVGIQKEKKINISNKLSLQENNCNKEDCYKKPNVCKNLKKGVKKVLSSHSCKIWAGGEGKPNDIIPSNKTILPEDILPKPEDAFETRKSPYYTQYWTDISYNLETERFGKLQISRKTSICIPGGTSKKIDMPKDGWSYIIHFDFMNSDGFSYWPPGLEASNDFLTIALQRIGGLINDVKIPGASNRIQFQNLFKVLLFNKIAIINLSELSYDLYPVYDCSQINDLSPWSSSDWGGTCWNDGNNLIRPYLDIVFNKIKNDGFNNIIPNNKFNYDNMGLIGYSGPAQMVSRCINNFPLLQTNLNICYPKIKASILIGGGSLHCYEENDECPNGKIEPNYDNGIICWDNHPPVLLCQYTNDYDADPNASTYYFNKLNEKGVPVYAMKQTGNKHAIPICDDYSPDICLIYSKIFTIINYLNIFL